jgi:hypothetical protein
MYWQRWECSTVDSSKQQTEPSSPFRGTVLRSVASHFVRPGRGAPVCRWLDSFVDYHLARSFRRGAGTRATNAGVTEDDIDWLCRWNTGGAETGGAPFESPILRSDSTLGDLSEVFSGAVKR